jgi:hypothetical protein
MKTIARILAGVGVLAILVAGGATALFFELDFIVDGTAPLLLTLIFGGLAVGVVLIVIAAIISPRGSVVQFPLFRAPRSSAPIETPAPKEDL